MKRRQDGLSWTAWGRTHYKMTWDVVEKDYSGGFAQKYDDVHYAVLKAWMLKKNKIQLCVKMSVLDL